MFVVKMKNLPKMFLKTYLRNVLLYTVGIYKPLPGSLYMIDSVRTG